MIKIGCFIVVIFLLIIGFSHYNLKSKFASISLSTPEALVVEKMGKPPYVEENYYDNESLNWVFYQYPIPTEYVLMMKDGVVVGKNYSDSP